jgi:hypothetical protein
MNKKLSPPAHNRFARFAMVTDLKSGGMLAALVCIGIGAMTCGASAVTAKVAKTCDALTAKAYPSREPGNPASGGANTTVLLDYYHNCVANGGKVAGSSGRPASAAAPRSGDLPAVQKEHSAYKPCPAAVELSGREECLGLPGRGEAGPPAGRRHDHSSYKRARHRSP